MKKIIAFVLFAFVCVQSGMLLGAEALPATKITKPKIGSVVGSLELNDIRGS